MVAKHEPGSKARRCQVDYLVAVALAMWFKSIFLSDAL